MTYKPKDIIADALSEQQKADLLAQDKREKDQGVDLLKPRLDIKKLAEIDKTFYPPPRTPVEGLIIEGCTILAGAGKIGKSWLAFHLCMAVAAGKPFLGRKTTQGNVLYLALEDVEESIQERAKLLRTKSGIVKEDYAPFLDIVTQAPPVKEGLIPMIEDWLSEHKDAVMICIDVMQKVRGITPGNRNAYQDDYAFLTEFTGFAKKHRIAVVLLHHLNKRDVRTLSDPFDSLSGSTGILGTTDTGLLLHRSRGQNQGTLQVASRRLQDIRNLILNFDSGYWSVISEQNAEVIARQAYEQNEVAQLIKAMLQDHPHGFIFTSVELMQESTKRLGKYVTDTPTATTQAVKKVMDDLHLYDNILVEPYRAGGGGKRGFKVTRSVTSVNGIIPSLSEVQTTMND